MLQLVMLYLRSVAPSESYISEVLQLVMLYLRSVAPSESYISEVSHLVQDLSQMLSSYFEVIHSVHSHIILILILPGAELPS